MSDSEGSITSSKIRSDSVAQQRTDEVLNDHRNQRETLPPPEEMAASSSNEAVPWSKVPAETPLHRRASRSQSICDPIEDPRASKKSRKARASRPDLPRILKIRSNDSLASADPNARTHYSKRERRPSRSSVDLEADSHASRSSQETEEDVCFPMLREHVRINGIDFDEIEDFINEERESQQHVKEQEASLVEKMSPGGIAQTSGSLAGTASVKSKNAIKYSPKNILLKTSNAFSKKSKASPAESSSVYDASCKAKASDSSEDAFVDDKHDDTSSDNVKFGGTRINDGEVELPDRFSFFHSDNEETIHSPDLPSLISPGNTVRELFKNGEGTWWLDCTCPTDAEMKTLAKAFGIHPLTAEDIRMQESREKVELFRNYYFVCFHTFEPDKESEDYLEPIYVYIVVFREGVLTFHFSPVLHPANVRRRVRQLRDYVDVSADWIGYAMIDDITDGFAPVITAIEYEADAIEDSVFEALSINFSSMLRKIGESRRKVMTLMRLLSNKADVIRMFAKRCQDEAWAMPPHNVTSRVNLAGMAAPHDANSTASPPPPTSGINFGPPPGAPSSMMSQINPYFGRVQPRADIALYLGDIQDHVVTMFQNLSAYEKIFSRSHANYLAQLQVESFNSNLTVTKILGNVTMIGTMFLPLNVITGLFGMNVKVLGEGQEGWFWGIIGFMVVLVVASFVGVKYWLRKMEAQAEDKETSKKSIKSFSLKNRKREAAKSILSFPNRYD
ncbi:cora-domain-containing protein [Metschnikowia bicuspidata var. bicuspidata NRRL YB-4993]|uniref:Cora-domain-containing protein n=1 Tax=Metschnikowia bicuspidata var. bicuspidata NRRL YB-4993 TaxID=869754 RepID=A0A1A0GZ16_9ASCO|nr:cora-domain-containing protein [Metschnikowia bicuspidata var. bicuspidata NRRL YB-4993]OBA16996.1 cora-domain-containing protein [Metschnikowia bicuspidata var. bicuspidata NRRL YB-4993]